MEPIAARLQLLKVNEAAARLGLSKSAIYAMVQSRAIPFVRLGRSVRFPVAKLEAWLEARQSQSAAQ